MGARNDGMCNICELLINAVRLNRPKMLTGLNWGGENRRVYRWNFNPIFVPYLKVSGFRFQVSGMMNRNAVT